MNESTALAATGEISLIHILPPDLEAKVRKLTAKTKLDQTQAEVVLEKFREGLMPLIELRREALDITVTDGSQASKIARAKEIDMVLASAKKTIEATHKDQKEYWLRGSQMVDGCKRIPTDAIDEVRGHLKKQFDFVHLQEVERLNEIERGRLGRLAGYEYDLTGFSLRTMSDAQFDVFLAGVKAEHERRAEEDRLRKIALDDLAAENRRLAAEREEAERKLREAEAERRRYEAEAAAERQRIEDERRAEESRIAAEKAAEEQSARAKALAPDKDKLLAFADEVAAFNVPTVTSPEAVNVLATFSGNLTKAIDELRRAAKALAGDADCPF